MFGVIRVRPGGRPFMRRHAPDRSPGNPKILQDEIQKYMDRRWHFDFGIIFNRSKQTVNRLKITYFQWGCLQELA